MARLTLYFCDLCGEPKPQELGYKIVLSKNGEEAVRRSMTKAAREKSSYRDGDICVKCYEALVNKLEQEIDPHLPQARKQTTRSEKVKSPALFLSDDDGINIIPSKMTDERRREINNKQSEKCDHSRGFTMEDGMPHCKDCKERVTL